jgi:hypothetical protein
MPFLSSNPPSADDLITVFEQNTWLTINAAAGAVKGVLGNESEMGGCLDPATRAVGVDTHLSATILADLNAQGIQPMDGGGTARTARGMRPLKRRTFPLPRFTTS